MNRKVKCNFRRCSRCSRQTNNPCDVFASSRTVINIGLLIQSAQNGCRNARLLHKRARFVVDASPPWRLDVSVSSILDSDPAKRNICLNFNISKKPGRPSIWLRTRERQSDAASYAWAATRVTEAGNILKCISLRCAVENRAQLRIAKYSMCVYEGWEPRGAAADTDRHAGRGELIRSSALSCSNTHNASVPWVASLQ